MSLNFFLGMSFGLAFSIWLSYFLRNFACCLVNEIGQAFQEIFELSPSSFSLPSSRLPSLQGIRCNYWLLCCFNGLAFILGWIFSHNAITATIYSWVFCLLYAIAVIDWSYRLIAMELCQLLLSLGVLLAYLQLSPISLTESLQNAALMFGLFYLLFQVSQYLYKKEVFGRGDYWLISALSSFLPIQTLALFICLASTSALTFAMWQKIRHQSVNSIPFAPFLNLAALITFFL